MIAVRPAANLSATMKERLLLTVGPAIWRFGVPEGKPGAALTSQGRASRADARNRVGGGHRRGHFAELPSRGEVGCSNRF